jgi:hypothetical protein
MKLWEEDAFLFGMNILNHELRNESAGGESLLFENFFLFG